MVRDVIEDVAFRDAPFSARARDRSGIEVVLLDELAHGGPHLVCRGRSRCRGRCRGADAAARCCAAGAAGLRREFRRWRCFRRRLLRGGRGRRNAGARFQNREQLAARHDGTVASDDLFEDTVGGSRDFEHDFVGLEVDEVLFAAHCVAGFLVPGDERGIRHGLGQLWNLDLDAHWIPTLSALVPLRC